MVVGDIVKDSCQFTTISDNAHVCASPRVTSGQLEENPILGSMSIFTSVDDTTTILECYYQEFYITIN